MVAIGGETAQVQFAGLTGPGLYQLNVVVPSDMPAGDAAVSATVNGLPTPVGLLSIAGDYSAASSAMSGSKNCSPQMNANKRE